MCQLLRYTEIPSAEQRIEWLNKSIELVSTNRQALNDAMNADFGHRSKDQSDFSDILSSIDTLKYAKRHLRKWMRPEKRKPQRYVAELLEVKGVRGGKPSVKFVRQLIP